MAAPMMNTETFEQQLLEQIRQQRWASGERLPTERVFSEQTGLSRAAVRKVLQRLKAQGLITQTVGSGTYVAPQAWQRVPAQLASALAQVPSGADVSPADLMTARLVLEPAIMELVVLQASASDFEQMLHCCEQAEAAQTLEDFEHWDAQLHEVIAQAAHNRFILSVFGLMSQARQQAEWGLLKRRSVTPERRLEYQQEHRALVQALMARDAARARATCLAHLRHVRHNMMGE